VSTDFDHNTRQQSQRLADLQSQRADLQRALSDNQMSLDYELTQLTYGDEREAGPDDDYWYELDEPAYGTADRPGEPGELGERDGRLEPSAAAPAGTDRTEVLVSQGRRSAHAPGISRRVKVAAGAVLAATLATILGLALSGGGASWPASVATVQGEAAQACRNPDVASEPGGVNFACATDTRQVLWVFALLASRDNPAFDDTQTGRLGLEPITPAQGEEVAWSLNLHHPYDPADPVDSLEVAARAINNIIGGATSVSTTGRPVVEPGLESRGANCLRYTGSAALTKRSGYPSTCAEPLSAAGQGELVTDIYKKWVVGGSAQQAANAAVLFENAKHPGNPEVRNILRGLAGTSAPA
jgi:hypothetical protein